jgi:hypothetical protein
MYRQEFDEYGPARQRLERLRRDAADDRLARALRRQRKEEIAMATRDEHTAEELREWAHERVQLRRRLWQRAAGFALGMLVLTPVWAVGEYLSSGGWPQRLSANDHPGDWSPWIIWVALAWGFYVALTALALHYRRPPVGDREIERELARLAGQGRP